MTVTLRHLIDDGRVHLFDGAMGTMLYAKGIFVNTCYDELNLRSPDIVLEVHQAYVDAGAEILETNTFGANPVKLAGYGLAAETEVINQRAAELARRVAGEGASVVGAIGPLGVRLEPFGETGCDEAFDHFRRQAAGLLQGGVDGFVLETFGDRRELREALRAVQSLCDLPVVAQVTVDEQCATAFGTEPEIFAPEIEAWGASVVGVNCSVGPAGALTVVERIRGTVTIPISAQPNAGYPKDIGDRKIYLASPEYVAEYARRLVEAGARFVGGCCGTTPEHVAHMRRFISSVAPKRAMAAVHRRASLPSAAVEPLPLGERSRWGGKLHRGEFVTTVEVVPPRGTDPSKMVEQCRALKAAGVDAVNVPDGPRAQSRMAALVAAILIERDAGVETMVHYCCRDRNLLGMLSDLLGASAAGLRNLLIITGDPPKMGPYPDSTAVFDIDSIGLTNLAYRLNHGLDPGDNAIGGATQFVIGVGVNPGSVHAERELRRFRWKVEAGAEFAITQPVFDVPQLERFLDRIEGRRIPIIAGIWPLISLRNAEFLANEVPGVNMPSEVLERMGRASASGKDAALAEGVLIAQEMLDRVRPLVQGVQVAAPFGRVKVAIDVFSGPAAC